MNNPIYKYKLSIIVVNYNVEYFLDQCLHSVKSAINNLACEVIIVDNASIDGSLEMIHSKYDDFKLLENKINVGFSKANNQAIKKAEGEYILLLNPDTIVAEDSFDRVISFMDKTPDAGGLGVKMIDGKGNFLPESKRGLPSPMVAFYKISGLSKLFPKSKRFGQYHLGHLPQNETNEIDILSGAFMLMRSKTLDEVGLLDEDFFMYGEDIDLSYRILKGGYKNYYYSETEIIHYKGESTKKSSVNYVFVFYKAMVIFAKKHFSSNRAGLFSVLINFAIYLRASLAITSRLLKRLFLPVIDLTYIIVGLFALTNYWKMSNIEFPENLNKYSIPIYAFIWVITVFFNGGYDKPLKLFKFLKGAILGTLLILIAYAILPKSLQFSRLFIFIGAAWVILHYMISRIFLHFVIGKKFKLTIDDKKSFSIIGNQDESERVLSILKNTHNKIKDITLVNTSEFKTKEDWTTSEVIFCSKNIDFKSIISFMSENSKYTFDYKIAPSSANYLIGSSSIDTAGDFYMLDLNTLISSENKRKKRLFDLSFSLLLIITFPICMFYVNNKSKAFSNLIQILLGKISFIGFSDETSKTDVRLPIIKPGVLFPRDSIEISDATLTDKLNILYARDYSIRKDFSILWKSIKKIDR